MCCEKGHGARVTMLVVLVLLPAAVVGCGRAFGSLGSDATPASTSLSTPSPDGVSGQTPSGQTPSGQLTAGPVTVTLAQSHFDPQEPLLATIHNGLNTSIWAQDHQSGCTLLAMEYLTGGIWDAVAQCTQPRPPKAIEIPAGSTSVQYISYPQEMDMAAGWAAGTYRMTLIYALSRTGVGSSAATTVHSAHFTIG